MERSSSVVDVDLCVDESVDRFQRGQLIDRLVESMQQLERFAKRITRTEFIEIEDVLVHSQYIVWYRGGKQREGYVATVVSDAQLSTL